MEAEGLSETQRQALGEGGLGRGRGVMGHEPDSEQASHQLRALFVPGPVLNDLQA